MADNILTNPYPDMARDSDYVRSRIIAAYWYCGDHEPTDSDFVYWQEIMASKNDGWSGYWWDKIVTVGGDGVTLRLVVHPEPVDPDYGAYLGDHQNPFHPTPGGNTGGTGSGQTPGAQTLTKADLDAAVAAINAHTDAVAAELKGYIDLKIANGLHSIEAALAAGGGVGGLIGLFTKGKS